MLISRLAHTAPVIAAVLVASPVAAQAAWHAEEIPGAQGGLPPIRTLTFDREGRALMLFEGFARSRVPQRFTGVAVRGSDGTWARPGDIAGIGWGSAGALLYGRTRALLVTRQVSGYGPFHRARFRLVWATGRSDGSFGPYRRIAASASVPAAAADPSGDALVAYTSQLGLRRPREPAPRRRRLRPATRTRARGASRRGDGARGDAVVAWSAAGAWCRSASARRDGDGDRGSRCRSDASAAAARCVPRSRRTAAPFSRGRASSAARTGRRGSTPVSLFAHAAVAGEPPRWSARRCPPTHSPVVPPPSPSSTPTAGCWWPTPPRAPAARHRRRGRRRERIGADQGGRPPPSGGIDHRHARRRRRRPDRSHGRHLGRARPVGQRPDVRRAASGARRVRGTGRSDPGRPDRSHRQPRRVLPLTGDALVVRPCVAGGTGALAAAVSDPQEPA